MKIDITPDLETLTQENLSRVSPTVIKDYTEDAINNAVTFKGPSAEIDFNSESYTLTCDSNTYAETLYDLLSEHNLATDLEDNVVTLLGSTDSCAVPYFDSDTSTWIILYISSDGFYSSWHKTNKELEYAHSDELYDLYAGK